MPARSTIHAVLDRHGLVKCMGRPRPHATGTRLSSGAKPNDLWCADFKGDFKLGNGRYCYPLTVTDHASRLLLLCEALESTREDLAFTAFERLFAERGLPLSIRSDNGVPFASPNALFNLSKLAVWWRRLGVTEVDDGIWLVSFFHDDPGYIDLEQRDLAAPRQPVRPEVVTHVLGTFCYPCLRAEHGISRNPCVRNGPVQAGGPRPTMMSTMSTR